MTYSTAEAHFETLDQTISNQEDYELALRFAPLIKFDSKEPFFPSVVGYTIFNETTQSSSFPRTIEINGEVTTVIEYAIWWDWDIQHLYELEHIWVYLDANNNIIRAGASSHGGWNQMLTDNESVPLQDGQVIVHSEPGKHAFSATRDALIDRRPITDKSTGSHAGKGGVWITPLFDEIIHDRTPINNRLVYTYLSQRQFKPTYEFTNIFSLGSISFVPWHTLFEWIPTRVHWWVKYLDQTIPYCQRHIMRIAHRGASAYAQEGSTSSIHKAVELGADVIEIDIRFTADNIPVVAHDSNLKRVYDVDGMINELTLEQLKSITPADKKPILTFKEMVELCHSLNLGLYLDIKEINSQGMHDIFGILDKNHMFRHTIFASFRPDWVAEIKANRSDAVTSILFSSTHVDAVALGQAIHTDYVHPCFERFDNPHEYISGEWINRVRKAGFGVICWHEERPKVIEAIYQLGVDGICSDMPELLTKQSHKVP